jgi:hypothetical protein
MAAPRTLVHADTNLGYWPHKCVVQSRTSDETVTVVSTNRWAERACGVLLGGTPAMGGGYDRPYTGFPTNGVRPGAIRCAYIHAGAMWQRITDYSHPPAGDAQVAIRATVWSNARREWLDGHAMADCEDLDTWTQLQNGVPMGGGPPPPIAAMPTVGPQPLFPRAADLALPGHPSHSADGGGSQTVLWGMYFYGGRPVSYDVLVYTNVARAQLSHALVNIGGRRAAVPALTPDDVTGYTNARVLQATETLTYHNLVIEVVCNGRLETQRRALHAVAAAVLARAQAYARRFSS